MQPKSDFLAHTASQLHEDKCRMIMKRTHTAFAQCLREFILFIQTAVNPPCGSLCAPLVVDAMTSPHMRGPAHPILDRADVMGDGVTTISRYISMWGITEHTWEQSGSDTSHDTSKFVTWLIRNCLNYGVPCHLVGCYTIYKTKVCASASRGPWRGLL